MKALSQRIKLAYPPSGDPPLNINNTTAPDSFFPSLSRPGEPHRDGEGEKTDLKVDPIKKIRRPKGKPTPEDLAAQEEYKPVERLQSKQKNQVASIFQDLSKVGIQANLENKQLKVSLLDADRITYSVKEAQYLVHNTQEILNREKIAYVNLINTLNEAQQFNIHNTVKRENISKSLKKACSRFTVKIGSLSNFNTDILNSIDKCIKTGSRLVNIEKLEILQKIAQYIVTQLDTQLEHCKAKISALNNLKVLTTSGLINMR